MLRAKTMTLVALSFGGLLMLNCNSNTTTEEGSASSLERGMPSAASARSISSHYVEVTFDRAVEDSFAAPEAYRIISEKDESLLAVRGARPNDDWTKVVLTTDSQKDDSRYSLTILPAQMSVSFEGTSGQEMTLGYAVALSNTSVLLTFGSNLQLASATNSENYVINNPDLEITGSIMVQNNTVTLTTSPQSDQEYTVKVVNLLNSAGSVLINPNANTAAFVGIDPVDTTSPTLVRAEATDVNDILCSFSEPLENFAGDVASYEVDNGMVVLGVVPNAWNTQVRLNVLPMTPGTLYTVTVSQVEDRAGNVVVLGVGDTANFTYTDLDAGDPASVLPRLSGVISTSNRTVLVTYNKPMSDSAIDPQHYEIVQENFRPEAGFLSVSSASFVGASRTAVELATLSQNELTYSLTVSNVEDTQGNQIAPKELLVDPATDTFRGTPPTCPYLCVTPRRSGPAYPASPTRTATTSTIFPAISTRPIASDSAR